MAVTMQIQDYISNPFLYLEVRSILATRSSVAWPLFLQSLCMQVFYYKVYFMRFSHLDNEFLNTF